MENYKFDRPAPLSNTYLFLIFNSNMNIGFNFSIQPSLGELPNRVNNFGCQTFQFFTRSNRQWKSKDLTDEIATKFRENYSQLGFTTSVIHLPYLPNFATSDITIRKKSIGSLKEEIIRAKKLGIPNIVLHLGSHKGEGDEVGISNVIEAMNEVIPNLDNTKLCLETSAGHMNSVGKSFEELNTIIEAVSDSNTIGICLDTAHVFSAGYDLRTEDDVNTMFNRFESIIGMKNLQVVHLNDSKADYFAGVDRHEHIGKGSIGLIGFRSVLNKLKSSTVPIILETPVDDQYGNEENWRTIQEILK